MSSVSPGGDADVEAWALGIEVGACLTVWCIIFEERWSMCVDIGVEVEPTANGDGIDEPALTGADKMVPDQENRRRARSQGKRW